ncbi:PREDICTED: putative 115 kDa protein in type-1 retrotransposable element R1DM [Rhagoletis zephyria]|uniref:putative 115 kDa protein in type-1 retrotransposable element R1DM n=1 Tax=Rhagoletis zephyria TaxID=28612 RepID=UPI0008113280|nr:PREDICTED: putative 115 kDa protein in type-1 retrotransposable element R1DM [Rhagoletis zephyria]
MTNYLMAKITQACDASMKKKYPTSRRAPVYWWNEQIADLRLQCNRARRNYQRARRSESFTGEHAIYRAKRKELKQAIKLSKRKCFTSLCESVQNDPWGLAYKVVTKRLKASVRPQVLCPNKLETIIKALFPMQPSFAREIFPATMFEFPMVSTEEVLLAAKRFKDKKSPGPDAIPNRVLKLAVAANPKVFVDSFNECFKEGVFPDAWKRQRLVLLPKTGKPPEDPSAYRPICMLDTTGKLFERIISDRLLEAIEEKGGLSETQFGFRKGRSTVDAASLVKQLAEDAISGERWKGGAKEYCLLVTLDVKNAFNTASWKHINAALRRFEVPAYLRKIVDNYLANRVLLYNTENGVKEYKVSAGVPQGSVLGPILWNIMYDGVLRLSLPERVKIVGFADDIALVVVAKHLEEIITAANSSIVQIQAWLAETGLELAHQKTETVLGQCYTPDINCYRQYNNMQVSSG